MTLCFKKAAMKIVFAHLEATMGRGWWGDNKNKDFYDNLAQNDSPWNWIKVLPAMSKEVQHATGALGRGGGRGSRERGAVHGGDSQNPQPDKDGAAAIGEGRLLAGCQHHSRRRALFEAAISRRTGGHLCEHLRRCESRIGYLLHLIQRGGGGPIAEL